MLINSASFQIVKVADILAVPAAFPEHVCYYTEDTDKYYIYRNSLIEEIFTNYTELTHAEIVSLSTDSKLIPGRKYKITDFQTIYDQPDFNADGTPKIPLFGGNPAVKTGPIEPIVVTAATTSTIERDAFQEAYSNDKIQYILEYTTPVTNTPTKGRIVKRIDDLNNESDFDHRNVLFKRYVEPVFTGDFIEYRDNGEASQEFLIMPNLQSSNNYLGDTFQSITTGDYPFDLPNAVLGIGNDPVTGNTFKGFLGSVSVWGAVEENRIHTRIDKCIIRNNFTLNEIIDMHDVNVYGGQYSGGSLQSNKINSFQNCNHIGEIGRVTVDQIYNVQCRLSLEESQIKKIYNVFSDVPTRELRLYKSSIDKIENLTIGVSFIIEESNIGEIKDSTISKGAFPSNAPVIWNHQNFRTILGCEFRGPGGKYNTGNVLENCLFNGYFFGNDFGQLVKNAEFGDNFGMRLDSYQGIPIANSLGKRFTTGQGNIFMGSVENVKFGSNTFGNVFKCGIDNMVFNSDLVNNYYEALAEAGQETSTHAYESYPVRYFMQRILPTTVYSIGDSYIPEGFGVSQYPYQVYYRSESVGSYTRDYFALSYSDTVAWQNTPSLLGTIDGLGESDRNAYLLIEDSFLQATTSITLAEMAKTFKESIGSHFKVGIPTLAELQIIYNNRVALGFNIVGKVWSSTENGANNAWAIDFSTGSISSELKTLEFEVITVASRIFEYDYFLEYRDELGINQVLNLY